MTPLTAEQIADLDSRAKYHEKLELEWIDTVRTQDILALLFTAKKYLEEVEEHANAISALENMGIDSGPAFSYHEDRLAALKEVGK